MQTGNAARSVPPGRLLAAIFVAQSIGVGTTLGAFSVFVDPIARDLGSSRFEVSIGIGLMSVVVGVGGPFFGRWMDTGRIRAVLGTGAALLIGGFALASVATELWQLAVVSLALGGAIPLLGPMAGSSFISKVFQTGRGRALGLVNMGGPTGNLLFALVAGSVIEDASWRSAVQLFAVVGCVILVPLIAFALPRRVGDPPESRRPATESEIANGVTQPTRRELLGKREYIGAALGIGIAAGLYNGWFAHLAPFASDLGHGTAAGARVVAMAGGMGLVGTLSFGLLADRISPRWLLVFAVSVHVAGLAVYLTDPPYPVLILTAGACGACHGGFAPLYPMLLTERFGAASLGTALGMTNLFLLPFGATSAPFAGALRESQGNYHAALLTFMGALCVSALCLTLMGPARQRGPGRLGPLTH